LQQSTQIQYGRLERTISTWVPLQEFESL
jgi:hypothetical protein